MAAVLNLKLELDEAAMSKVVDNVNLRIDTALDDLVDEVEWTWRKIAASSPTLKSTKSKYIDAIKVEREGDEIVMSLTDELASAMESGSKPYDLKPGFLKGKQSRIIPLVDKGTNNVTRFRTVTQGSSGWIHPGHKPTKIVDQVKNELETTVLGEVLAKAMRSVI